MRQHRWTEAGTPTGKKRCRRCRKVKPAAAYWKNKAAAGLGLQTYCKVCVTEYNRERRAQDPARYQRYSRESYQRHAEKKRAYARARGRKLREEVLHHYGGEHPACACCGEDTFQFLALDHIHGNGAQERKKYGLNYAHGIGLKRRGFPPGFQILCHNCNLAKGFYGVCPHVREQRMLKPKRKWLTVARN